MRARLFTSRSRHNGSIIGERGSDRGAPTFGRRLFAAPLSPCVRTPREIVTKRGTESSWRLFMRTGFPSRAGRLPRSRERRHSPLFSISPRRHRRLRAKTAIVRAGVNRRHSYKHGDARAVKSLAAGPANTGRVPPQPGVVPPTRSPSLSHVRHMTRLLG